jgi:ribosomal protein S18 acetylase RimI-like enzyme
MIYVNNYHKLFTNIKEWYKLYMKEFQEEHIFLEKNNIKTSKSLNTSPNTLFNLVFNNKNIYTYENSEGNIIGYLTIDKYCYNKIPFIRMILIDTDYQNKGIASELVQKVVKDYNTEIKLEYCINRYEKLEQFYIKNGFKEIYRSKLYVTMIYNKTS